MLNKVILIGRITKDLDMKSTPNGAKVLSFVLAANRRFKQEGQPDADFINCVVWNKVAELMNTYCHKGSQIAVVGRLQTRNYDDKDGKKVYITEVVVDEVEFLDSKSTNKESVNTQPQATPQPQTAPQPQAQPQMQAQPQFQTQAQTQQTMYTQNPPQPSNTLDIASDDLPF